MSLWWILLVVCVAGAVGGVVNALMSDNGFVSFGLNPMLGIGSSTWEPCCHGEPGWGDSFSYHEVAWTGACTVTEHVYDGCLQVDGDADPTVAPHAALLPVDIRFGRLAVGGRLVIGRRNC